MKLIKLFMLLSSVLNIQYSLTSDIVAYAEAAAVASNNTGTAESSIALKRPGKEPDEDIQNPKKKQKSEPLEAAPYPFVISHWPPVSYKKTLTVKIKDNFEWRYKGGCWWFIDVKKQFFKKSKKKDKTDFKKQIDKGVINLRYKIHLMPQKKDLLLTINKLLNATKTDPELLYLIEAIKVKDNIENLLTSDFTVFPIIVIYPHSNANYKDNAQALLNKLYLLFDDQEGLDITPRWNQKVTSLIYYAQGDGDDKINQKDLFEEGNDLGNGRVHYKPEVTGSRQDYHLTIPGDKLDSRQSSPAIALYKAAVSDTLDMKFDSLCKMYNDLYRNGDKLKNNYKLLMQVTTIFFILLAEVNSNTASLTTGQKNFLDEINKVLS